MLLEILDGAIFIADAHENSQRKNFFYFLEQIEKGSINPPQLFLMGDIFDLLVGDISFTCKACEEYIQKLDLIAEKIPVFYFEGNHDFNLSKLFSYVKVFPIEKQPVLFDTLKGKVLLLHGDKYSGFVYHVYTFLIRNSFVLKTLLHVNNFFSNSITAKLDNKLAKKNQCNKIEAFEKIAAKRAIKLAKRDESVVAICEGHHHQNRKFLFNESIYYNFSSFACDKSYFVVQLTSGIKFSQVKLRGKDV